MATKVNIGGDGELFAGEDKLMRLFPLLDTNGVPVDMSGWTVVFEVRRRDESADPAVITKTCAISGTYDADPDMNEQKAIATLEDTDLPADPFGKSLTFRYSFKRTDAGFETILARGDFKPERATQV